MSGIAVRVAGFGVVCRVVVRLFVSVACKVVEVSVRRQVDCEDMCWICWGVVWRSAKFGWSLACVRCLCLLGGVLSVFAGGLAVRAAESEMVR